MTRPDERGHIDFLLKHLVRKEAYPHPCGEVLTIQTHISIVLLAGRFAYKVKKPVTLGFLDFGTLERRRWFCHEEVRLNRRLAPSVYHGVVPIVRTPEGTTAIQDRLDATPAESPGETGGTAKEADAGGEERDEADQVVEWAVRMKRLPEERTLKALLGTMPLPEEMALLTRLAELLAEFHARAERGPDVSRLADYPAVARNAADNFRELEDAVGFTLARRVLRRLRRLSEAALAAHRPLIERRARNGMPCDTHGDLRLGHVYALETGLVVVDCIEFSARFRYADPMSDVAFLAMELEFEGRPELSGTFVDGYVSASGDAEGVALLPWFLAYRDIVRGKVRTLEARDPGVAPEASRNAAARARRHFLMGLGRLSSAGERPCLVLVAGLPGVGKSALAGRLADEGGFAWIDTDRMRKRLAASGDGPAAVAEGVDGTGGGGRAGFEAGIYTPAWTERTYGACLERAEALLLEGRRVLVEGSFRADRHRVTFLERARALGVPAVILHCHVDREVARQRLSERTGDVSDADWRVFEEAEKRWEEWGALARPALRRLDAGGTLVATLRRARQFLRQEGLLDLPPSP